MKRKSILMFFLFILSSSANILFAQTIEKQLTKSHPTCRNIFMNAMDILPALYKERSFDSISKAVDIWERSCGDMPEVRITSILLDVERSGFTLSQDVDGSTIDLLSNYAKSFPASDKIQEMGLYNEPQIVFYKFSSTWAKLLLENKLLNENEKFICRVLNGEIKNPQKEIKQHPETYPEFTVLLEKNFESKRKEIRADLAITTGVWLPTNNLSALGTHPSFGLQIGGRNAHHQFDLTMQIRYLHSPNTYAVKRDNNLDSTDYYFGGYIGLDYAYYLISKKRYDLGFTAGMGWDGFDFAEEPYNYNYYYYDHSHVTIGSFNANVGLRFNYYFTNSFYVGLQGRYNGINYCTHDGTNLSGDAISIDLIFGFHNSGSTIK